MLVRAIAEAAVKQRKSVLIATSSNSTADNALDKIVDSEYMVVRAHSLGLERRHLLKAVPDRPLLNRPQTVLTEDPAPVTGIEDTQGEPPNLDGNGDHSVQDEIEEEYQENADDTDLGLSRIKATADDMKLCEELYRDRERSIRPEDSRMQKRDFTIYTWILKLADIIPSKFSLKPTSEVIANGTIDEWADFRTLWGKMDTVVLDDEE